jgi:uncharacterized protein
VTTRRVAWRRTDEVPADEHCTLAVRDGGLSLVGTVLASEAGIPVRDEYRVFADGAAMTTAVHVRDLRGFEQREVRIERSTKGVWTVDGAPAKALKGCTDIDLGCSPSTNTLPIRRLRLAVGATATIQAALVTFPALEVVKTAQTYTRLDESTYRFVLGDFEADLTVDEDGLVAAYGPWTRTALAFGPEAPEALDSR